MELARRDALAAIIPAFAIPAAPDLRALPVGRREDGTLWTVRLHGTHLLVAGSTGAGKGPILWGLIRALQAAMQASGAGLRDLMARMGHDSERAAIIYQHEARGADAAITRAIDAHAQAERHST